MCEMLPRKLLFSQCRTVFPTICLCDKTNYTCSKIGICYRGYRPITAHAAPPVFYRLSSQLKNNCSLKPVFYNTTRWPTQPSYFRVLSLRSNISPQFLAGPFIRRAIHRPFFTRRTQPSCSNTITIHDFWYWYTTQILRILFERKKLRITKKLSFFNVFSDNRVFGISAKSGKSSVLP